MRAVRVVNGTPTVTEVPEPTGDGVRVDIRAAGICGSDVHVIAAGYPIRCTLGHELAGTLADGTPVAIEPLAPCRTCAACVRGDYQLCERGFTMIIGMALDGGMADRVLVPPSAIVPLPRGVDVRDASLVEPIAVNVHGLRRAGQPDLQQHFRVHRRQRLHHPLLDRRHHLRLERRHIGQAEERARLGRRAIDVELDLHDISIELPCRPATV